MGTSLSGAGKKRKHWILDRGKWWFLEDDYAIAKVQQIDGYWWGTVMPRKVCHIGPHKTYQEAMVVAEKFVYKLNTAPHSWDEDNEFSEAAVRSTAKPPKTLCGLWKSQGNYDFENH